MGASLQSGPPFAADWMATLVALNHPRRLGTGDALKKFVLALTASVLPFVGDFVWLRRMLD